MVTFCYLYFKRRNKCIKAHEEAIVDRKYRNTDALCNVNTNMKYENIKKKLFKVY